MPFPFGQGGIFHLIVYTHGYRFNNYFMEKGEDFEGGKYKEFSSGVGLITLPLRKITDAEEYYFHKRELPPIVGDEYLTEEMQYFLDNFPTSDWRADVQIQLNRMKKQ